MKKIEKLTPEQIAALAIWRADWIEHGLSTEPADRVRAAEGVIQAYQSKGLEPPLVIWLRSPLEGAITAAMLQRLPSQVRDQVGDQVGAQVGSQVRDQVWDQVGAQVGDQVNRSLWGQHDAGWLGWADYFDIVLKLPGVDVSRGLRLVAQSAGWWWAMRGVAVITERPNLLNRDARGRLHAADGPAMSYPDGWSIWAWHGVRVPQQVIKSPETLTPGQILKETNAEVRRVMIERFTAERLMRESKAKLVSKDDWGTLWSLDLEGDEPLVLVQVTNSTPEPDGQFKDYWLRVPPAMKTPREAVLWTHDLASDAVPLAMS